MSWILQRTHILLFLVLIQLLGCNSDFSQVGEVTGTTQQENFFGTTFQLRIVTGASGNGINIADVAMAVGDNIEVHAALYDLNLNYAGDAAASWSMSSSNFAASNLVVSADKISAVFTPTNIGPLVLTATYVGPPRNLLSDSDSTGTLTVSSQQIPDLLLSVSGDNQNATVNSNLAQPLKVQLRDTFGQGIPGRRILFGVTQGAGAVLGPNPAFTDENGEAVILYKLGTLAAANSDKIRATFMDDTSKIVDFQATANPGAENNIIFTTLPDSLYTGSEFGQQPVVTLRDIFNNTIPIGGNVTLSVQTGIGNLTGTITIPFVNGIATFTNVGYDTAENPVVIRATKGAMTVDTPGLDITSPPPGACLTNDASFITSDGGCKDLATGLIWSRTGPLMGWYSAVWDSTLTGASPPDVNDKGRTNGFAPNDFACDPDYCDDDNNIIGGLYTPAITAYCHDLVEGGYSDWRLATLAEGQALVVNRNAAASPPYINNMAVGSWVHVSDENPGASTQGYVVKFSPAATSVAGKGTTSYQALCMRGDNRTSIFSLQVKAGSGITTIPSGAPDIPVIIQVEDSNGNRVNVEGLNITAATDLGAVGGGTVVSTNKAGQAIFDTLTLDTEGNALLTFTAVGATSVNHSMRVINANHICAIEDAAYNTEEGGCRDLATGLVWSAAVPAGILWHSLIWDSTLGGNAVPEPWEVGEGRTDDYALGDPKGGPDTSTTNYCHELVEGGKTDWRVADLAELTSATINGAATHFGTTTNLLFFASSSVNAAAADVHRFSDGVTTNRQKTAANGGICVRSP